MSAIDRIAAMLKTLLWNALYGLRPLVSFPVLITSFLSNHFREPALCEIGKEFLL